jgi:hypothetical protein
MVYKNLIQPKESCFLKQKKITSSFFCFTSNFKGERVREKIKELESLQKKEIQAPSKKQ